MIAGVGVLIWVFGQSKEGPVSSNLNGTIEIDGSSTVFPITEAVAEEFHAKNRSVETNVGVSGTGGGFKRFVSGETDISNASRPIKTSEVELAKQNNITYSEYKIALDGIVLVVNQKNDFVQCLTAIELKKIWEPGSQVAKWNDIRTEWPAEAIKLYGPGTDSGTFDYFTEVINGKEDASRSDYTASEDDNILVKGVSGDTYGLGYFGYAYYVENKDILKLVEIDNGKGCVAPTPESIEGGQYSPLSRPLFIYVKHEALARQEIVAFTRFYLEKASELASEVGYIRLSAPAYEEEKNKLEQTIAVEGQVPASP